MVKFTRRDFIKMAGAAGVGIAAFGALERVLWARSDQKKIKGEAMSSPHTWVSFLAGANEIVSNVQSTNQGDRLSQYSVQEVIPVIGEAPNIVPGWSIARVETPVPISLEESLSPSDSLVRFYGVTQNLHYTSDAQRQELVKRARPELEPSEDTLAVLIPIRKSEEWWKLAQDQRQAYFHKSDNREGHTAIGAKYVDRVFRKLYHSRYLNAVLDYDFLTYFEFKDTYKNDFKTLLAELRDTNGNPEWNYVNREFEIWMTKVA
jgi:hypothetical protein